MTPNAPDIRRRVAARPPRAASWLATICAAAFAAPAALAQEANAPAAAAAKQQSPAEPAQAGDKKEPPEPVAAAARSRREIEFVKRMDALIAPLRDLPLSAEDAKRIKEQFQPGAENAAAAGAREQIGDPIGRKLVDWARFRRGAGTPAEIRAFVDSNPDWPSREQLLQKGEELLWKADADPAAVQAFYGGQEPRSGLGFALRAVSLLASGDEKRARELAVRSWRQHDLPAQMEARFVERLGKLLAEADHKWRLDRLLASESRWEDERAERAAIARRVVPLLPEGERAKANARIAVYLRSATATKLLADLPADAARQPKADWGLTLQMAQHHRRSGKLAAAGALLRAAPMSDAAALVDPDGWWAERRRAAYEALKATDSALAYDLVKEPGPLTANPLKEATFMAGWIALRHRNDPKLAEGHFRAFVAAADGPLSRAAANFWLARALEQQGRTQDARAALQAAARNGDTFHGLLAMQTLEPNRTKLSLEMPAIPGGAVVDRFLTREAVKAVVVARRAGLDPSISRIFLTHLRNAMADEPEAVLLSHLAEALDDTQMAVRIAKSAVARGMNLVVYGYPTHPMPGYKPLRKPPEPALLLAIARQESEFNPQTQSGAGARGLLQVMPITARHVCKDYKIRCDIDRLMSDPAYNATLASAYIADRMDDFAGSYVLAIAGYNAGPGRARQWIREFGDPRDPKVDVVEWIHRIPFEETREYVQKVLSNLQIYRARLGDEARALQITTDLARGRGGARAGQTASSD